MASINPINNNVPSANLTISAGNLSIPTTSSTIGKIVQNGIDFIHTFGSDNIFIGTPSGKAGNYTLTGTDNVAIGANVMQNLTSGSLNFGIGTNTLNALTSGQNNVGYGIACLQGINTTNQNIAIGNNATRYTTGSSNIGIGYQAYQGAIGTTTGSSNTIIGTSSGSAYVGGESNNIILGASIAGTASESNITRIGASQSACYISGISGVSVANLNVVTINTSTGQLGSQAGSSVSLGTTNHAVQVGNASGTLTSLAVGSTGQTIMGSTGADPAWTGSPSFSGSVTAGTTLTASSGAITATSGNVVITSGNLAITAATTSSVGQITQAGARIFHTMGGTTNVFAGTNAGNLTLTGTNNAGFGSSALVSLTNGADNTSVGRFAGSFIDSGTKNTAVGSGSVLGAVTGGASNTALGYSCFANLGTTASFNCGLGQAGGSHTTTDSSNICIGHAANGVTGASNRLQIGAGTGTGNGQLNKSFIHGIRGITTTNADAIAVLVDSAGQLGTVSSSIRFKENIKDLGDTQILNLRPTSFNFKRDGRKAVGLIAEEVEQIMPELVAYNSVGHAESVKYHDLPVYLLAEIQKLRKELNDLKKRFS